MAEWFRPPYRGGPESRAVWTASLGVELGAWRTSSTGGDARRQVVADLRQVTVVVNSVVDFTLLNLVTPGDTFAVEVRATARPSPSA